MSKRKSLMGKITALLLVTAPVILSTPVSLVWVGEPKAPVHYKNKC